MAAPAYDAVPILIELHNKYLESNPVAVEAVQPYTGHDHKMASVMNFLRSNTVDNCVTLLNAFRNDKDKIQKYASNLQNTILNAPTINSPIVLFRGLNIKLAGKLVGYEIDVFRNIDEGEIEEDVDIMEFSDEIDEWVLQVIKEIGCDTAKSVLNLSREELITRTDLEEETIDRVLEVLKSEFEDNK